jgi:tetratricopeptide (TPR) repeat protein
LSIPIALAWILLGAALFRAVSLALAAGGDPMFGSPILDAAVYHSWAERIAGGSWLAAEPFYFPPLYPYAIGILYRVAGSGPGPVAILQSAIGLANILLVFRIGERVFGRRAAILGAAGAALYAPFPFFESKVLGTTFGIALNLAGLLLWLRAEEAAADPAADPSGGASMQPGARPGRRIRSWFAAGGAIGAAALVTPAALLLGLLAIARQAIRRQARAATALGLGLAAAILPVAAHNFAVARDPMPLSAQGGITFYQGNNAQARGLYAPVAGFSGDPSAQAAEEKAIAERDTGRALRRSEVTRHFFEKGLAWIAAHPADWIVLELRKAGHLIGNYEPTTEYSLYEERARLPWLRIPCLPFAVIAGFGLAGAWRLRGHPALRLFLVYGMAVPLIFYVSSRYRVVWVPALLIYAGALVDRLLPGAREPPTARERSTARDRTALLAAIVMALVSFAFLGGRVPSTEANALYNLGNVLADRQRHDEAIAAYDRALRLWPDHPLALVNRGNSLLKMKRVDEAMASYLRAEEARPGFWPAIRGQAIILRRQGRFEEEAAACRRGLGEGGAEAQRCLDAALARAARDG